MTLYQIFPGAIAPNYADDPEAESSGISVGTEFHITADAWVTEVRWLKGANDNVTRDRQYAITKVNQYAFEAIIVPATLSPDPGIPGTWVTTPLATPVFLVPGSYKITIFHPGGRYTAQGAWFKDSGPNATTIVRGPLRIPNTNDAVSGGNGTYTYGTPLTLPSGSFNGAAYFADVTVSDVDPASSPTTISFKSRESGIWVDRTAVPKVWDGSGWVQATPKRWDSATSTWTTLT